MYPAVEKDASLLWIPHKSVCNAGHPPGWAREARPILASAPRPPELAARIGTHPGVSRQGSASSNDGQPESLRESATYACGAVNRRSVDVGSCARHCFAAATPPQTELGPAEGESPIKSCGFMPMVG